MFDYQKVFLDHFDPKTFLNYQWNVRVSPGEVLPWQGFYTGPLVLRAYEIEDLCELLLGVDLSNLAQVVTQELVSVTQSSNTNTSLFLHSTTPELNAFLDDLNKLQQEVPGLDYAAYKEVQSVYFAQPDDLCVGRVTAWETAIETEKVRGAYIANIDYYYLSQALIVLAKQHLATPVPVIKQMIDFLTAHPNTVARVYALEQEMQIFLVWLKRMAQLDQLKIDSNSPEISQHWNNKRVLYPSVEQALGIPTEKIKQQTVKETLANEGQFADVYQKLKVEIPRLPGYIIIRENCDEAHFAKQIQQAAQLLQSRYGLTTGCFKACSSGDGARITPNIPLADVTLLTQLANEAYTYDDDYLLEAHVTYLETVVNDFTLKTTPSAHIRQGEQAPGITLQFMEGTSWKGNLYLDAQQATKLNISAEHYTCITNTMRALASGFQQHIAGLNIAGIDFAIGRLGGHFGDEIMLGVQDPNLSFNGAECLRTFMDKKNVLAQGLYGATLVIHPHIDFTLPEFRQIVAECFPEAASKMEVISIAPDCWGMIATAGKTPQEAIDQLVALRNVLATKNIIH
ncbi:hypothetical protein [uncultured Microscilla sp.]|uniref:hypothetical protein n=1 Tax=uncultured Microscilla sp. TaxID=432653 RepID=UPI002611018C|nr:hypothetical protein [uncultured Microscilla sp.]